MIELTYEVVRNIVVLLIWYASLMVALATGWDALRRPDLPHCPGQGRKASRGAPPV